MNNAEVGRLKNKSVLLPSKYYGFLNLIPFLGGLLTIWCIPFQAFPPCCMYKYVHTHTPLWIVLWIFHRLFCNLFFSLKMF